MLNFTLQVFVFSTLLLSCFQERSFSFLQRFQQAELVSSGANKKAEKPTLSFSSSVKFGKQTNQLTILVSTDFSGVNSIEDVQKATWKAIKGIKLASGEELQESGLIDLSAFVKPDQPFYIAFKYTGEVSGEKPTQRTWQISNVKLMDAPVNFQLINHPDNDEKTGWAKSSAGIAFKPAATLKKSEGWAVSAKLQ